MAFITTTANSISSGGTINGSITIEGDLTVNGDGAGAYDEIIDGNLRISSTNKLEFGDTGTYIHQSADGVLDLVSDTEIEINATTIDVNGSMEVSGTITASDDLVVSDELRPYEIRSPGTGGIRLTNSQGGLVGSLGPRSSSNYGSGLKLEDDIGSVIFGTDSDYSAKYDSGSDALEIIEGITSASETVLFSLSSSTTEVNTATTNFNGTAINFESSSADSPILTIKNTNAGDGSPRLYFNHASASPEDNDELGQIRWYGLNDAGTPVSDTYARIKVNQTDVSSGSEAGKMSFQLMKAGTETDILILDGGKVGIGIAPTDGLLHIYEGSAGSVTAHANGDELVLESDNSEVGMSILGSTTSNQNILFGDPDDHKKGYITYAHNGDTLILGANAGNVMKLDGNSKISLSNNDLGASNTVLGKSAGNIDSNSNYNTFVGENCSDASMNGATSNTAIGYSSASGLTSGDNNVMVGSTAGKDATTSSKSVYIGAEAGEGANHNHNTYIGYQAGKVSGNSDNTAVGYLALGSGSNGYSNVAIGREALKNTTGHMAVAVGEGALQENTSGQYNVGVGWSALRTNVDGDKNTAVGYKSLYTFEADTDGHGLNSALGWESGMDLTTGTENTLVGSNAGGNLTDGDQNTALGSYALAQTVAGSSSNTALGYYACGAGDITNSGITAVGAYALAENVGGQKNVAVGFQAGNVLTAGSQNTIVGYDADTDDNSATNQTVIGSEVTGVADNSVTLGNASVTDVYMAQDKGATVHANYVLSQGNQNHVANTMSSPYYHFDGTNDYISLGTDAKLDIVRAISLSSWVRGHSSGGDTSFFIICRDDDATHQQYFINFSSSALSFRIFDGGSAQTVSYSVDLRDDKWHHVAGIYDGSNLKLYLDGVEVATQSYSGDIDSESTNETTFIGQRGDNARRFYGDIAQAQIFNLALSATEIKNLYSGESLPYKYKSARNTSLVADYANKTGDFGGTTSSDGSITSWTSTTDLRAAMTLTTAMVKGKTYTIQFDLSASMPSGVYCVVSDNTNLSGNRTVLFSHGQSSGTFTTTIVALDNWTQFGFVNGFLNTAGVALPNITNMYIREEGCVAEFDGSGIASDKWLDKSGNDLHGTVTTADVTNAPSGDDGLVYEEGTWTPVFKSNTDTITIPGTATYKRVGNMVSVFFGAVDVTTSGSTGSTGQFQIQQFPYTAPATKQWVGSLVEYGGGVTFEGEGTPYIVISNGTTANLYQRNDAQTQQHADITGVGANSYFSFQITYEIA